MGFFQRIKTGFYTLYLEGTEIFPQMLGGFMSEEVYAEVVKHTIIVCTDVIIINKQRKTVYLAKRCVDPMPGLWVIGGRRRKGESPIQGMLRNFYRETGLCIDSKRFELVDVVEYFWQTCAQEPKNVGSHNIAHQFCIELSDKELDIVHKGLHTKEYDSDFGLQEFSKEDLKIAKVHPVIQDVYEKMFDPLLGTMK